MSTKDVVRLFTVSRDAVKYYIVMARDFESPELVRGSIPFVKVRKRAADVPE